MQTRFLFLFTTLEGIAAATLVVYAFRELRLSGAGLSTVLRSFVCPSIAASAIVLIASMALEHWLSSRDGRPRR